MKSVFTDTVYCDDCGKIIYRYAKVRVNKQIKHYCIECYLPTLKGRYPIYAAWKSRIKKYCKSCRKLLPATEEYFKRSRNGEYGLSDTCWDCVCEKRKVYEPTRRKNMLKVKRKYKMSDWFDCVKFFDEKCAYCGSTENICQDHIVPISKLGDHVKQNIVPACRKCNSQKSNHNMEEWYSKQAFFDDERYNKILEWINKRP